MLHEVLQPDRTIFNDDDGNTVAAVVAMRVPEVLANPVVQVRNGLSRAQLGELVVMAQ